MLVMMMMMLVIITLMLFPILSLWMARIRFDSFLSSKRQTVENILIIQRFLTSCPAMTPECPPRLEKWVPILTFFFFSLTQLTPLHSDRLPILTEELSLFSFFSIRCHSSISLRALPGDHFTTWFQCVNASG